MALLFGSWIWAFLVWVWAVFLAIGLPFLASRLMFSIGVLVFSLWGLACVPSKVEVGHSCLGCGRSVCLWVGLSVCAGAAGAAATTAESAQDPAAIVTGSATTVAAISGCSSRPSTCHLEGPFFAEARKRANFKKGAQSTGSRVSVSEPFIVKCVSCPSCQFEHVPISRGRTAAIDHCSRARGAHVQTANQR